MNLPKYRQVGDAWERIIYSIQELTVLDGYTVRIAGSSDYESQAFTLYNLKEGDDVTSVSVTKRWTHGSPQPILVTLYANGVATPYNVMLTSEMNWHYLFADLPKFDEDMQEIVYTVVEDVPEGYVANYSGTAEQGFVISNETIPTEPTTTESTTTEPTTTEPTTTVTTTTTESTTTLPTTTTTSPTTPTQTTGTLPTTAPTVPATTPHSPVSQTGEHSMVPYGLGLLAMAAALALIAWYQRRREEE